MEIETLNKHGCATLTIIFDNLTERKYEKEIAWNIKTEQRKPHLLNVRRSDTKEGKLQENCFKKKTFKCNPGEPAHAQICPAGYLFCNIIIYLFLIFRFFLAAVIPEMNKEKLSYYSYIGSPGLNWTVKDQILGFLYFYFHILSTFFISCSIENSKNLDFIDHFSATI